MCITSPPRILALIGLMRPIFSPIPARRAVYLPTACTLEKMEFRSSSTSTRTQLANCLIFVLTPAIIGVGKLILKVEKHS